MGKNRKPRHLRGGRQPKEVIRTDSLSPPPPLPAELIALILDKLSEDWNAKLADLARCALVSSAFLALARERLYRSIKLGCHDLTLFYEYLLDYPTTRLLETLGLQPTVSLLVRKVTIARTELHHGPPLEFAPILSATLLLCKNVQELEVPAGYEGLVLDAKQILAAAEEALPPMQRLTFNSLDGNGVMWMLLAHLQRQINHVVFHDRWPKWPFDVEPDPLPHLALTSLSAFYYSSYRPAILELIFSSCSSTLTTLHLGLLPATLPDMGTFPNLRTLTLEIPLGPRKVLFLASLPTVIKAAVTLRHLIIDPATPLTLSNIRTLSSPSPTSLAANLPASLERLHLDSPHFYPADLVAIVETASHMRLREIGVQPYRLHQGERDRRKRPALPTHKEQEEMYRVCGERGVRVVAL
ncbi:hypothetical protein JCM10207_000288 [Rhodosporidiobolus poonsookiae]